MTEGFSLGNSYCLLVTLKRANTVRPYNATITMYGKMRSPVNIHFLSMLIPALKGNQ